MACQLTYDEARELGLADQWPADQKKAGKLALPELTGKRSKYGAVVTKYKGVRYASKSEAHRARILDGRVESGEVLWWVRQVKFCLGVPENSYVVDFLVVSPHGVHAEDVKGFETPKFQRDRKLWLAYGPCPLHIITRSNVEIITPIGAPDA